MSNRILSIRKENAKDRKAAKFVKEYYAEHGAYPSLSLINEHRVLTAQEIEAITFSHQVCELVRESEDMGEIVKPEVIENTPAQEEVAEEIVNTLMAGTKTVVIEDGTINNFTIPSGVTVIANITGELADGATIVSESTKSFTINNTSEEPVSVVIEAKGSVTLSGKFENIYLNGKTISVANSNYPEISGKVTIAPEVDGAVSLSAAWQEGSSVEYLNNNKLTIANSNQNATIDVYAPYATVEVGGKWDEFNATVSDNTLVLKSVFHTKKLNLKKGSILFYGTDISEFVDEPLAEGVVAVPYTVDVTAANYTKMSSNAGVYNLTEDIVGTSNIGFTVLSSGNFRYNLNGHSLTCGRNNTGSIYLRGTTPTVSIYGEGSIINNSDSYGVWVATSGSTLNVYGGNFSAYTHVLYAYSGTINVYGGAFRLLGDYEKDAKGRAKFLLNCYDANYTSGSAKINVYGGKFYNFNPAESYGEPGAPVSFVAEGYGVREYEEGGESVFEVIPLN